ncbi:MAG: molybdopterin cofactor-binding domain-containing protein, partial [Sneathiella sp.]
MNNHHQNEKTISRRFFLKAGLATAGSLQFSLLAPTLGRASKTHFNAGAYIRILPDNSIVITIGQSEMGQGSLTGMAQIIAEELDANWDQVTVLKGGFGADFFRPQAPIQVTGGSGSIRSFYTPLRQAGAAAKQAFITAAAKKWNVKADVLQTDNGEVLHPDGRRSTYGDLIPIAIRSDLPDLSVVP